MQTPIGRMRLANGGWARPRVLWAPLDSLDARKLEHPVCILAAATPGELGQWRLQNRWAESIPLVTFGGDDLRNHSRVVSSGHGPPIAFGPRCASGLTPYLVDNAPPMVHVGLRMAEETPYTTRERDAVGRYLSAVEAVATVLPHGPVWWIHAESDQGIGAVQVASTRGGCVALAAPLSTLGPMGAALANRKSVDVAVHAQARGHA